ncbi:hypothetical protein ONZ45_g12161 [Pleurotus djamor]|nr:hypothetical protein ONZ45_g12161 [Pleurotus djamor]
MEAWGDGHFSPSSLSSLGLTVQLGHSTSPCPLASDIRRDFLLIDTSGHHLINLRFCGCSTVDEHIQLLRSRWYPASTTRPRTVFTYNYLNAFHILNLQSKLSAYDYAIAIQRQTDPSGVAEIPHRYKQFLLCIRQFRHLHMLLQAGIGLDSIDHTTIGALAIECPACPHPDINLPEDWNSAPLCQRWLYTLRLTINANFCLKNRERVTKDDTPLGDGWGHWVEQAPYMEYIKSRAGDAEPNLCDSKLKAMDLANKKKSSGYSSTGVVAVLCAQHGLVRRNGMGSLQKGERYANTDFVLLSTLRNQAFAGLCLSYNIACQWSQNLAIRNTTFPQSMQLATDVFDDVTFIVPKFHLYAHGPDCQSTYSPSYLPWMAETDGEDPERWWAHINPLSMSTKIMGPGSRVDTIDDHAVSWNQRKVIDMGRALHVHLCRAITMRARHAALHVDFTASFEAPLVNRWRQSLTLWENDPSQPNPFEESDSGKPLSV